MRIELLPDLNQIAIGAKHEAIEHLNNIDSGTQGGIDRGHLQANDAAPDDQHSPGLASQRQGSCGGHHARVIR